MDCSPLDELKIEVTYQCPLECIHCSSCADESNPLVIAKEKCFEIIREASEIGVNKIAFSGGNLYAGKVFVKLYHYVMY